MREDSFLIKLMPEYGFQATPSPNCTFVIDTSLDPSLLWKRINGYSRNRVRKARNQGVEVWESAKPSELSSYFSIYRSTMHRHGRKGLDYEFFDLVHGLLMGKGKARLFLASHQGRIVAGIIVLVHSGKAHAWTGGSLQDSWKVSPNELLIWHIIEWASNSGISHLDLGPTPKERGSGQNLFKRHLGAKQIDFVSFGLSVDRTRDRLVSDLVRTYRRLDRCGLVPRRLGKLLQRNVWAD
jgi:CelD/BcsL family acetyltransferase involved in cellulose biosynthesis